MTVLSYKNRVLWLYGASSPFMIVGPRITADFVLSPAYIIGALLTVLLLPKARASKRVVCLFGMLIVFLISSLYRHSPESYLPSLLLLTAGTLPTIWNLDTPSSNLSLQKGVIFGLKITVATMAIEIALQLVGLTTFYHILIGIFRDYEEILIPHNIFFGYYRPYAFMPEPSFLALYLFFALVFLEVPGDQRSHLKIKVLTVIAIALTGTLTGYIAISFYYFFKFLYFFLKPSSKFALRRFLLNVFVFLALACVVFIFPEIVAGISQRFSKLFSALLLAEITGSEGSRVNFLVPLATFFKNASLIEVALGTGYGNYEVWLIDNFHSYGEFSSFARGQVNNSVAAVLLSTGLSGVLAYFLFIYSFLWNIRGDSLFKLITFVVVFLFSFGSITSYFFWMTIFILSTIAKHKGTSEKTRPRSGVR